MEKNSNVNIFHILVENYLIILNKLIDFSIENNMLPIKYYIVIPFIRNYIKNNKILVLQSSIKYILEYKDQIIDFSSNKYSDIDFDDNVSRKECINNINFFKKNIEDIQLQNNNLNDSEIFELLICIKNNYEKLNETDLYIFKGYIELLIKFLEQIKKIFV